MKKASLLISTALVSSVLVLSGCNNADSSLIKGPSGNDGYVIKCGLGKSEVCYQEAAKKCPKGYKQESFNVGDLRSYRQDMLVVTCK